MADPANFDKLQEDYARRQEHGVRLSAARSLLTVLDVPQPEDANLSYVGVLRRLYTVIATEIEQQGDENDA